MFKLLTDIFYTPFASVWREIDIFSFFYNKNKMKVKRLLNNITKSLLSSICIHELDKNEKPQK